MATVLIFGCSDPSGGVKTVPVAGTVEIDATPLATGFVTFNPEEKNGTPAGLQITNGRFEGSIPPGAKVVSITSSRVVGQRKAFDDPNDKTMIDITENIVAPEFNVKTTLKCDIPEAGKKDLAFQVKSAKPSK